MSRSVYESQRTPFRVFLPPTAWVSGIQDMSPDFCGKCLHLLSPITGPKQ